SNSGAVPVPAEIWMTLRPNQTTTVNHFRDQALLSCSSRIRSDNPCSRRPQARRTGIEPNQQAATKTAIAQMKPLRLIGVHGGVHPMRRITVDRPPHPTDR